METVRVGLIGAGGIFGNHAEALRDIPGVELSAVCDIDGDLANKKAAAYGIPRVETDWQALLDDSIDAVFILTPPMFHAEQSVAALNAGKYVFCEKPLAHTLEDGRAILDAVERSGKVFQIGFNNLFEGATREMWQMHKRGELGRLVRGYDRHMQYRATSSWTNRRDVWRLDQAASGGRMQEFGSHKVHWLLSVAGRAKTVVGRSDIVAASLADHGVDDTIMLLMDFAGGGVGSVEVSLAPTVGNERVVGLQGTEASVEWTGGEIAPVPVSPESRQAHFIRWVRQHDADVLAEPPTPEVTVQAGYHTLEVCLAFLESANDGMMKTMT